MQCCVWYLLSQGISKGIHKHQLYWKFIIFFGRTLYLTLMHNLHAVWNQIPQHAHWVLQEKQFDWLQMKTLNVSMKSSTLKPNPNLSQVFTVGLNLSQGAFRSKLLYNKQTKFDIISTHFMMLLSSCERNNMQYTLFGPLGITRAVQAPDSAAPARWVILPFRNQYCRDGESLLRSDPDFPYRLSGLSA